jgi:phenylalanyl-tRNA synthetase beta chain
MTLTEVAPTLSTGDAEEKYRVQREGWFYTIAPLTTDNDLDNVSGTYFPGRAASILLTTPNNKPKSIGTFGILHPQVLSNFDIHYPASCVELDLEALL